MNWLIPDPKDLVDKAKWVAGKAVETSLIGIEGQLQNFAAATLGVVETIATKIAPEFKIGAEDFTVFGSIKYWDNIIGKIKDSNQALGVAGELGMNLQSSFREAYPLVVNMGIKAEEMAKAVQNFFEKTGRAQMLSANEMAELAKMSKVFGDDSIEIATTYRSLGLSINTTTSRMRNLIKESDKFGILPAKISNILKSNIDAVNKYSFKGGVKALEQMAIYAAKTNTSLQTSFDISERFLEGGIEGAMELSANLQLLGGSFANLGNVNQLYALARNDKGELSKRFFEAAKSLASYNEETREIEFNQGALDRLRIVAKDFGITTEELVKSGRALFQEDLIKKQLDSSLRALPEYEKMITKISGAAKQNELGEWVVKLKKDGKEVETAVSALTKDTIKQISFTDATTGPEAAFEKVATSNERLVETMERLVETLKVEALSTAAYERFNVVARDAADNIKDLAAPFIKMFQEMNAGAMENVFSVLDPLSKGDFGGAFDAAKQNLYEAGQKVMELGGTVLSDIGTVLYNVFTNAAKYLAAGIEWGFRNAIGYMQQAIGGMLGITVVDPEKSRIDFESVAKSYGIKPITEGTIMGGKIESAMEKYSEKKEASSVVEPKKETPQMIEKNLIGVTPIEKTQGEVTVKGSITVTIDGVVQELSPKMVESMNNQILGVVTNTAGRNETVDRNVSSIKNK